MSGSTNYQYGQVHFYEAGTGSFETENHPVASVEKMFAMLPLKGTPLAAEIGDKIQSPKYRFLKSWKNRFGYDNHFQGIQRLKDSSYLVLSGGDKYADAGHLFIVKMASRYADGPWKSNLDQSPNFIFADELVSVISPNQNAAAIKQFDLNETHWHAGGISICGNILAVPLEGERTKTGSKIIFYNMENPEYPELFQFVINRPHSKASAVALTRLANGYFLLAVLVKGKGHYLDFYLSKSRNFSDGFRTLSKNWKATTVESANGQSANFSDFQNINFVTQRGDQKIYLVGFHNTSKIAPLLPGGRDYADLYTLEFPTGDMSTAFFDDNPKAPIHMPRITKVANKRFRKSCKWYRRKRDNFDAGAGIYADRSGNMFVYGCSHFIRNNHIKFNEYAVEIPVENKRAGKPRQKSRNGTVLADRY